MRTGIERVAPMRLMRRQSFSTMKRSDYGNARSAHTVRPLSRVRSTMAASYSKWPSASARGKPMSSNDRKRFIDTMARWIWAEIKARRLLERQGAQELDQAKENDRTPERDLAGRRRRRKDDRQKREDK